MRCPSCDHDNIPGADLCEDCGLDLAGLDVDAWGVNPEDPLLAAPLEQLPVKPAPVLRPQATVSDAIALMRERHSGCVFVEDENKALVGVLTERDVTVRIAGPGRDPAHTRIEEVMTRDPVALQPTDPLAWGLHRMGVDGYRHLPLVRNGELIGYLSIRTVLKALFED